MRFKGFIPQDDAEQDVSVKHLLSFTRFVKPYAAQLVLCFLLSLGSSALLLYLGILISKKLDMAFLEGISSSGQLIGFILVFFGIMTANDVVVFLRQSMGQWATEKIGNNIRESVFGNLLNVNPDYYETYPPGEIQTRITDDVKTLQFFVGTSLPESASSVFLVIGGVIWAFKTSPTMTWLVLISIPIVFAPSVLSAGFFRRLGKQIQDKMAIMGSYVGETLRHTSTVQSNNHQTQDRRTFRGRVADYFRISWRAIIFGEAIDGVTKLLVSITGGFLIWKGGMMIMSGELSLGELIAFGYYGQVIASSLGILTSDYLEMQTVAGASEQLEKLLLVESTIKEPEQPKTLDKRVRGEMAFNQIRFAYPSRPEVDAVSIDKLHLEAGKSYALVGPSGAGKSTIFSLIQRFYDPDEGEILVDGIDIRDVRTDHLRAQVGIVPQEPVLFTGDVWHNIRYSRPEATDEQVKEAAKAAFALEFIEELPRGFDTFLGEDGTRLSGGQKQRIGIARAILKDPSILLLDEATSALDSESEHQVQLALKKVMENRTTLIIAHRLATVVDVHTILVMDGGKVIDSGTHETLLRGSEAYRHLAERQFGDMPMLSN